MIEVRNVSKSFGSNIAVENISFTINKGERLILLSVSGCDKTTTLKMFNKLTNVSNGTISVEPIGFNNAYVLMMRKKHANEHGVSTISACINLNHN